GGAQWLFFQKPREDESHGQQRNQIGIQRGQRVGVGDHEVVGDGRRQLLELLRSDAAGVLADRRGGPRREVPVVVKSSETGAGYGVGCGWSAGWLIQAVSGSVGGWGRWVKRSGCSA